MSEARQASLKRNFPSQIKGAAFETLAARPENIDLIKNGNAARILIAEKVSFKINFQSKENGAASGNLTSGFCGKKSVRAFRAKENHEVQAAILSACTAWFSLDFLLQKPGKFP